MRNPFGSNDELGAAGCQMERVHQAGVDDDLSALEKRHLARLGAAALAGAGLLGLTLALHPRLNFELTAILVLMGAWGVGWMIRKLWT